MRKCGFELSLIWWGFWFHQLENISWDFANLVRLGWGDGGVVGWRGWGGGWQSISCVLPCDFRTVVAITYPTITVCQALRWVLSTLLSYNNLLCTYCNLILEMRQLNSVRLVTQGHTVSDDPRLERSSAPILGSVQGRDVAAHWPHASRGHVLVVTPWSLPPCHGGNMSHLVPTALCLTHRT